MPRNHQNDQVPVCPKDPEDDVLLDTVAAAKFLGGDKLPLNPGTLAVWRCIGRYDLPYEKIGRSVRYRLSDLRRFRVQWRQHPKSSA